MAMVLRAAAGLACVVGRRTSWRRSIETVCRGHAAGIRAEPTGGWWSTKVVHTARDGTRRRRRGLVAGLAASVVVAVLDLGRAT